LHIIGEDGEALKHLKVLYYTLREMKGQNYRSENYNWRLGEKVISEIKLSNCIINTSTIGKPMIIFGIRVEVDYTNPYNMQIFEDITNKIGIKRNVEYDTSTEKS